MGKSTISALGNVPERTPGWGVKKKFAVEKFTAYDPFQGIEDMSTCLYIGLKGLSTNGLFTSVLNWIIRTALKIQKQTNTKGHEKSNERNAKIRKCKNTKKEKCKSAKNAKIQKFKNAKIQQYNKETKTKRYKKSNDKNAKIQTCKNTKMLTSMPHSFLL